MISGVVVIELRAHNFAPQARTVRILVLNFDNMHEALVRAVTRAFELPGVPTPRVHAKVVDFIRCDFDAIA